MRGIVPSEETRNNLKVRLSSANSLRERKERIILSGAEYDYTAQPKTKIFNQDLA